MAKKGTKETGLSKDLRELFQAVGTYKDSATYTELLQFIKRFPNLAPFNAMLVHIQKPGSQFVANLSEWRCKFHRTIKASARPVLILIPFGPVTLVYDYADTEGDPMPENIFEPFKTKGYVDENKFNNLIKNLPCVGVELQFGDYGSNLAGKLQRAPWGKIQKSGNMEYRVLADMVISKNFSKAEIFSTITHELGHYFCGHLDLLPESVVKNRSANSLETMEFEAESICWIVCNRAGLTPPSLAYLDQYMSGPIRKIPVIEIETMLKAAKRIENMISDKTKPFKFLIPD